ncbi:unnamed protein product [Cyprideis torosa]|uniref:Uncharacterized protein n=1 Tax=Cyprideis torosa TaxID=163714 RepID=A0A7R8ZRS5_9CRUS|nr:unnamed protein product [Cyprideis torosa]CAG0894693.1 unnamed protein product [Cyprideis torosa]
MDATKRITATLLALCALVLLDQFQHVSALSCSPCDLTYCDYVDESLCPAGIGKDVCGCCPQCLNGPGDSCGGPWNIAGVCGRGLKCVKDDPWDFNASGKCRRTSSSQSSDLQDLASDDGGGLFQYWTYK